MKMISNFYPFIIMMFFLFVGCSKEDEDETKLKELVQEITTNIETGQSGNSNLNNNETITYKDPEGTVIVNMKIGETTEYNISLIINSSGNFVGYHSWSYYNITTELVNIGSVNNLADIKSIPVEGWASTVAVIPGSGYVMREQTSSEEWVEDPYTGEWTSHWVTSDYKYTRIYVVGRSENIFTIKYQTPFSPNS